MTESRKLWIAKVAASKAGQEDPNEIVHDLAANGNSTICGAPLTSSAWLRTTTCPACKA